MTFDEFYNLKPGDIVRIEWSEFDQHVYGKIIRLSDRTKTGIIRYAKVEILVPGREHTEYRHFTFKQLRAVYPDRDDYYRHRDRGLVWFDKPRPRE